MFKEKNILLFLSLLLSVSLFSQSNRKIMNAEYYWNNDAPATLIAFDGSFDDVIEDVVANSAVDFSFGGIHTFHIRVQDEDGTWSPVFKRVINFSDPSQLRNLRIANAEYFWDNDAPTTLLSFDGNFNSAIEDIISNSALDFPAGGAHVFNIRVEDEDGMWSPVFKRVINFSDPSQLRDLRVANAEYFWDNDAPTTLLSFDGNFNSAIEDIISGVNLEFPSGGAHVFNIRVEDEDGMWSPLFKRVVYIHGEQFYNNLGELGCTDSAACNYNIEATEDDDSCDFESCLDACGIQFGDNSSCIDCCGVPNGDSTTCDGLCGACDDNNSCIGCIDPLACNYNPEATIDDSQCVYPNSCGNCNNIGSDFTQEINLSAGWSLFSTYICPNDSEIDSVMSDLVDDNNLIIVKDDNGFVYWPDYNINYINTMVKGKGYLVKLINESSLSISGDILHYDYPIDLNTGWSFLGYLHSEPYLIEEMLNPISNGNLIIVKDDNGFVYWPDIQINQIEVMEPGEGYQIRVEEGVSFSYPSSINGRYGHSYDIPGYSLRFNNPQNTGNNMVIGIPEKAWAILPDINDEILIYDQNNFIVGKAKYRENFTAITIWGDDEMTNNKDGLYVGEQFVIALYKNNEDIIANFKIDYCVEGSSLYSINGISIVGSLISNQSKEKGLVRVTDILGRNIKEGTKKTTLLHIYNDGSVERKYIIE